MTIDQKVEAYRMRLEGATLQSIADHFEVSLDTADRTAHRGQDLEPGRYEEPVCVSWYRPVAL